MQSVYVVHYNEIALKGRNRPDFLRKLQENICKATGLTAKEVQIASGRLIIAPLHGYVPPSPTLTLPSPLGRGVGGEGRGEGEGIEKILSRVFGISSFSPAVMVKAEYEEVEEVLQKIVASGFIPDIGGVQDPALHSVEFETFAIGATRGDKKFPITSKDLEIRLGDFVRKKFNKKVDLTNPDITFYVEVFSATSPLRGARGSAREQSETSGAGCALIYTQKIAGAGGMPAGIQGKAVALLSGGIDSPVATYRLMKRGAEIIGAHFHSYPFTTRASIDKVKELSAVLDQYGGLSNVYFIPIADAQKEIVKNCNEQYRILLYRRLMLRIARELAIKQGARALITGESLGQVASQTMENIAAVESVAQMPIFRPLIGYDKQEIIVEAQRIGTYEISIQPHDDCCSLFMPKQVATRARVQDVEKEEQKINVNKLVTEALLKTEQFHCALSNTE